MMSNAAQTVVVDGVGYTSGSLRLPPATGVLTDPNENVAYPKAHLNWATFDRDWKFLDGGAKQLQGGAEDGTDVPFAEISKSIDIKEPGYVYIWLSNTSAQQRDVFFDDFKVTHTKSPIVHQEEYYTFGLIFNSYARENSVANKYKFNGMEEVQDLGINWLLPSKFRTYDPSIARFNGIDPLSDKSNNITPYAFAMNNPLLYMDLIGADTTKTTVLQEVVVTAKKYAESSYNWFMGYDVGYSGSGWGHGPRRFAANQMGLRNTANNLFELGLHSLLQSRQVNLGGPLLSKIRRDAAMIKFQNDIIKALKTDPRFKNMAFVTSGKGVVEFGGKRWSSGNENWGALDDSNPLAHEETWGVAGNELTWATRHGTINYTATVKSDGTIIVDFHLSDTLDLSGQKGRSEAYNNISNATGFMCHDVVGGNSNMKINADWQVNDQ